MERNINFKILEMIIIVLILICILITAVMINKNKERSNKYIEVLAEDQHLSILEKLKVENEVLDIEIIPSSSKLKDVILYLNISTCIKNNNIYYDNKILIMNKNINLKINDIYFENLKILSISNNIPEIYDNKFKIKVLFSNLDPWLVEAINKGDEMNSRYSKDIFALLIQKELNPAKITGVTNEGVIYSIEDPIKKDIILEIEINNYIKRLKIGDDFYFETEKYNIAGKIIEL